MGLVDKTLSKTFSKLGHTVALYPKYFLTTSIIVAFTLGTGLLKLNYDNDIERLYSDTKGRSVYEKEVVTKYFKTNYTGLFSPSRVTEIGRLARIIIEAKDEETILRGKIWKEIGELDKLVHDIEIEYSDMKYNYSNLCGMTSETTCFENDNLELEYIMDEVENGTIRMSYPIMVNSKTYTTHVLALGFSGIVLSDDNLTMISASVFNINYLLNVETKEDNKRGRLWEKAISAALLEKKDEWKYIKVYHLTYDSIITEQEDNTIKVMPYFTLTIFLMCCFTVCTALSRDWVRAKPWVAMFGILAATLGSLAAFGFLSYIGIDLIGINLAVPFIMLGIGIDDTFVMLAAWRQTNVLDPVTKRLSITYGEAAVSITITSLTDMLSFFVGLLTPIPSVYIFCAYAGTCVFWIYLFQIFCFGAILGISGDQEAGNRHSVFWWIQATPKSKADGKSTLYKIFFTGGIDKSDPANTENQTENGMMIFFRDYFSKFIGKPWVQILVLISFIGYLGVSVYGLMGIEEGLRDESLYRDDSYVHHFYLKDYQYFRRYQFRAQIIIATPLNYSEPKTQARVGEILDILKNSSRYVSSDFGENWLTGFTGHVERYSELYEYNITTEEQFIRTLREDYFPNNIHSQDVTFNEDGTQIIASRYILQLVDTDTNEDSKIAIVKLREAAAAQKDVEVVIFNPWLKFVDQFILIRPLTIQLISIAAIIVMIVAIIFIPNLITSFCVFFTIASTELGVLGIMSLWGVGLDMVSILVLIMCIGFSVDFSAHVSYAYISSSGSPEDRIKKAMYSLGLPILQGGGSTVIGVIVLVLVPSYIYQVFFKVIFLVIVISSYHGLFILPVLLLIIKPERVCSRKSKQFDIQQP